MQFKLFRHWRIQAKIMTITVISVTFMLIGLFAFLLPAVEKNIMKEKQDATRHQVESAMAIIERHDAYVKEGRMPLEQAQKEAAEIIAKVRYEKTEYLWINDLGSPPKMVMHPTVPALNGKVLDDPKFNKATSMRDGVGDEVKKVEGKNLFVAFTEVARKAGHGFVTYEWPKPQAGGGVSKDLYPKLSYV